MQEKEIRKSSFRKNKTVTQKNTSEEGKNEAYSQIHTDSDS